MTVQPKGNEGQCARIGCNNIGYLSRRMGSSMYSFRVMVCNDHEQELNNEQ